MKNSLQKAFVLAGLAMLLATSLVRATPYATALTNTGAAISFRLNEAADSVRIIYDGGASTSDLGARAVGVHTVALTVVGAFQVEANRGPHFGYLQGITNQVSSDTNRNLRFFAPRGVAVNKNPASPYFGRVYVSNGDTGNVAAVGSFPVRNMTNSDGIYLLNSDFTDAVGQGEVARTAGINFRTVLSDTGNKPFRIEVGEDDNLYISDYTSPTNTPATGNLYVADPDVSATSGANVFAFDVNNTGRIPSSAIVKGSLAGGNLSVYAIYPDKEYSYDFFGSPATSFSVMQRWDVGVGPFPSAATPVRVTDLPILVADVPSVLSDIDIAPDGKYFITQNRSQGLEAGLFVVDPASDSDFSGFPDVVFSSLGSSLAFFGATNDLLFQTRAVKVSPDNSVVALVRDDNRIWVIGLVNGLPDLANRQLITSGVTTTIGRDISFDAACNLYIASSGQAAVKVFSPGYPSRAVSGSDGTFTITRTTGNEVRLTMVDTNAAEPSGNNGEFMLTRSGDLSGPLDIRLAFSGTATYGADYAAIATNITLAAGVASTNITLAVLDDAFGEALETVIVTIAPNTNYLVKGALSGIIFIADDGDLPSVGVTGLDTNLYERMANDTGRFVVSRQGDPSAALTVNVSYGGTAVSTVDYLALPTTVTIPAGQSSATNSVVAIDNALLDGNRTLVVRVETGGGYVPNPAATNTTLLIRDDEVSPTTPILFSDDFDTDTTANYTVRFGADNGVDDKIVSFNFDYSTLGIPSAPHSTGGTTRGLRVTANKNDAVLSTAGVNVYPNGLNLSNEFVLRFDMFLRFGATAGTTEHATFGLNHSGARTNRAISANGIAGGDGIWCAVETDGSASSVGRSYAIFGSTNATVAPPFSSASARTFDPFFTTPPFTGIPGGSPSGQWADVELSQTNSGASVVTTLKINAVTILARTNDTTSTNGTIMLGHMDSFGSIGSITNSTIYDNVRVISLTKVRPVITAVRRPGATVEVDFTAGAADLPSAFTLESSITLPGGFATDSDYSIISLGGTSFRATSSNASNTQRFFRIKR